MPLDFKPGQHKIIQVDGTETIVDRPLPIREANFTLRCGYLDTVNVTRAFTGNRKRVIMLVDDTGMIDGKPTNPKACELYWAICAPQTIHPICGDVALVYDSDCK